MTRRTIPGRRVILTGASSGIGRALAIQLALQGARLIITARRRDRLNAITHEIRSLGELTSSHEPVGREVYPVAGDITDAATRKHLVAAAHDQLGGLDLLVNNAGVGAIGPFADADESRLRTVMEVNFFAPLDLIRLAIPLLRVGQQPMIANVGSVLGHRAVPNKSEYCASKFAMHGFSDALRAELSGVGIDVLLVSPSTTESEFFERVLDDHRPHARRRRGKSPEEVARRTIQAIARGRHEVIISAGGVLLVWLDRLCPPLANRLIARFGS